MAYPPGPRSWIPGAHLRAMQRRPTTFLYEAWRRYGDVVHFTIGGLHLFLFAHPDAVRDVLVTRNGSFVKSRALQRTKIVLGEGLLTSEGELHRRQRRLAQPAFHRDRIRTYAGTMSAVAARGRERWGDGEELDIAHEMMRLTLEVVARTLFDADVTQEADEIGSALTELMLMFPLLMNPLSPVLLKLPLPRVRRFERAMARLDRTIYEVIARRRAGGRDRGDLLSMLLMARDEEGSGGMTDLQVRDEAMTLFLAGHETTANALAWTWYLLALNPEAEAALHAEVDTVLQGRLPAADDYPSLRHTEKVFAESMRLFPPAWAVGRLATEDADVAGTVVPRGSIALVSQWVTHRHPAFWDEPEKFDPGRFDETAKAGRPKLAYFPFGAGPRICIGEPFAWMEGVLILAAIAQRWRFVRDDPRPVETLPLITLRPRGGIALRAMRRESRAPHRGEGAC